MRVFLSFAAAAFVILVAGCSSRIRMVHLTPQTSVADVYLDSELAVNDLEYSRITDYMKAGGGVVDFKLTSAGQCSDTLIDCNLKVGFNKSFTMAIVGRGDGDIKCVMYRDDLKVDADRAKVRVVHASPDAPSIDVHFTQFLIKDGGSFLSSGEEPLIKDLRFKDVSCYEYLSPGEYEMKALISRTTQSAICRPGIRFEAGHNYTIFIMGQTSKNTLDVMSVVDSR